MSSPEHAELIRFLGQRFENIDRRFDALDRRLDELREEMLERRLRSSS